MAASLPEPSPARPRNTFPKPRMARAKLDLNFVQHASKLLRLAIARSGLSHKEAMVALGVEHAGQFSEMLDGKQKLWVHALLRPEARGIWLELIVLTANESGCSVERVVRISESA